MNKTGQLNSISIFIQVMLVFFFLGSGLGNQITYWTQSVIVAKGYDGLVAFILAYMNLWIILGLLLVTAIGSSAFIGDE